jgi:hypothetical protein
MFLADFRDVGLDNGIKVLGAAIVVEFLATVVGGR